jgi:pimeloyl-ACP methyl ester carboxylesterase
MEKWILADVEHPFEALLVKANRPSRMVLFASGGGGNPERHLPLFSALAADGTAVVAPYFERLATPMPTRAELLLRARRLRIALDAVTNSSQPVMGVGHSIGATLLVALSGGQLWLGPNQPVLVPSDNRFKRLVLMTPPTGFFHAPGALDKFNTPIQVWVGGKDQITPPIEVEFLRQNLGERVKVEVRSEEEAGHFTFMNVLPPQVTDLHPHREAFLNKLAGEIRRYLASE